jgi:hypothetical protein
MRLSSTYHKMVLRTHLKLNMRPLESLFIGCIIAVCAPSVVAQTVASCPVMPTLASSKVDGGQGVGMHIVIWYFNQGPKTIRGVQFDVRMLDAVGNGYPAANAYVAKGEIKPNDGDVVSYETKDEEDHFGERWAQIEGIEVHVTRVLYKDGSVWVPRKGLDCKAHFMNDEYAAELDRRWKAAEKKMKKVPKP